MDIERNFDDLGVDAVLGVQLMEKLGLHSNDFYDKSRFMRFKDVIAYLKDHPDRDYLVQKVTINKLVDKLDQVWSYIELLRQKDKNKEEMNFIDNEIAASKSNPDKDYILPRLLSRSGELQKREAEVEQQIEAYEN